MKIVRGVFDKIDVMYFGTHTFGARMFIPIGHRPMMDKLLNTKYE
jgi:hypothetical protein